MCVGGLLEQDRYCDDGGGYCEGDQAVADLSEHRGLDSWFLVEGDQDTIGKWVSSSPIPMQDSVRGRKVPVDSGAPWRHHAGPGRFVTTVTCPDQVLRRNCLMCLLASGCTRLRSGMPFFAFLLVRALLVSLGDHSAARMRHGLRL